MKIDKAFLDNLSAQTKANSRLRQSFDLRTATDDNSQRMLNAMEPGTIVPIHRHRNSSETMVIVRGKLIYRFYDDNGVVTDEFLMVPMESIVDPVEIPMVQVEVGQWHSLEVLESGTIIFEAKDGKYQPLTEEDIIQ